MARGGKREGAGRPEGSRNRRSAVIADYLDRPKINPVKNLVRLAQKAEADGDIRLAVECFKTLLPYYAARLKPEDENEPDPTPPQIIVNTTFPAPATGWRSKLAQNGNQGHSDLTDDDA